jgi:release factor glutamine methyltransferase
VPDLEQSRRTLLADATASLHAAGIASPRREALRIWADLAGETPGEGLMRLEGSVDRIAARAFLAAVERRACGEPLAHAAGWVGFRGLTLRSDRRALIPRPETEGLVDLLLGRVRSGRVADIGTGTGCLALSLAAEGEFAEVVGVDLSADALVLARENRALTGGQVSLVRGDLCAPLRGGVFDALVSNPPYLTAGEYAVLDRSVKDWEPRSALESGADGLHATARLLDEARTVLGPRGWLALEVDCTRAAESARRAGALGWTDVAIHADLFGRERYLLARRSEIP